MTTSCLKKINKPKVVPYSVTWHNLCFRKMQQYHVQSINAVYFREKGRKKIQVVCTIDENWGLTWMKFAICVLYRYYNIVQKECILCITERNFLCAEKGNRGCVLWCTVGCVLFLWKLINEIAIIYYINVPTIGFTWCAHSYMIPIKPLRP